MPIKLDEVKIPRVFEVIANQMNRDGSYPEMQYHCTECNQHFAARWDLSPGGTCWYLRGSHFSCPYCGRHYSRNIAYVQKDEFTPISMKISVIEFKNSVKLKLECEGIAFKDTLKKCWKQVSEIIEFNVLDGRTVITRNEKYYGEKSGSKSQVEFSTQNVKLFCESSVLLKMILWHNDCTAAC